MTTPSSPLPAVVAALDQASAEARSLREAVAQMWLMYTAAGMPEDLIRSLVGQYHRVALGGAIDPVTGPVFVGADPASCGLGECSVCGEEME